MKINKLFFSGIVLLLGLSSCRSLYPTLMLKDAEQNISVTPTDSNTIRDYRIKLGDRLDIQTYTNNGYQLINVLSQQNQGGVIRQQTISYLVDNKGIVKLPVIDTLKLVGLTIREAENLIEDRYSEYYKEPFVTVRITNRRVFLILGEGPSKVINIAEENPSLFEVIANAGGIGGNNKAYKIKIIRGDIQNPEIRVIDLRKIENMHESELFVMANDIIYVEPANRFNSGLSRVLAPYASIIGIVASSLTLYFLLSGGR